MMNDRVGTVSVRSRTDEDLEACISALRILYETENYPQGANRDLNYFLTSEKNQQAWIAKINGEIIGHVSTSTIAWDACIDVWKSLHPNENSISLLSRLFVVPEHRKLGVAEKLVNAAMESNAKEGYRLLLSVMLDSGSAIRLYDRLGWVRYGTAIIALPDGQKVDAICFVSPLQK